MSETEGYELCNAEVSNESVPQPCILSILVCTEETAIYVTGTGQSMCFGPQLWFEPRHRLRSYHQQLESQGCSMRSNWCMQDTISQYEGPAGPLADYYHSTIFSAHNYDQSPNLLVNHCFCKQHVCKTRSFHAWSVMHRPNWPSGHDRKQPRHVRTADVLLHSLFACQNGVNFASVSVL